MKKIDLNKNWNYAVAPESIGHIRLKKKYDLFIDGKFIKPESNKYFDTINPADGFIELITTYEDFGGYTGTGTLAKINLTAQEAASLDTMHIKDTSILKNSGNVSIDIVDRVYGLIEVVE